MYKTLGDNRAERTQTDLVEQIIEGGYIKPVYQPIVSLRNGQIYGYEALSRISNDDLQMNIEEMFRAADRANKSWELEWLCRSKALEKAVHKINGTKLFLNINPNIIYDKKHKEGFTKAYLNEYGLEPGSIVFEITEHVSVIDREAFLGSIGNYKKQDYGIALDDVGTGYSGFHVIAGVKPNLIKLDMAYIRDIDKDEIKQLLCKSFVDFCKSANILMIAEGIETEEELKKLIELGVDFGQGFFLGIPQESFEEVAAEKIELIRKFFSKHYTHSNESSVYPIIGHLAKPVYSFPPQERAKNIHDFLKLNPSVTEFAVVEEEVAVGFMTRAELNELFGGQYGYSLYARKAIGQLATADFTRVNYNMPVNRVSKLAMQRPFEQLYNPIVVEKDNKYWGIVTVKDLLDACTKIEVDIARHSNPLTGLPGNLVIENEIVDRIFGDKPYCITYYDIDNFKAYNDAYGFNNGDRMLGLVAEILKEHAVRDEFLGHIGGDDFIVICDYHEGEDFCRAVLEAFAQRVTSLYRDEDLENGYIISKNRSGVTENFPIASISIAGVSNKEKTYKNIEEFSLDIAQLKKKCKRQPGNYAEIL